MAPLRSIVRCVAVGVLLAAGAALVVLWVSKR